MSHTGSGLGSFGQQGLRQSRVLTPFVAAQNFRSVLHCWYNADYISVDSNGLVSNALDLTGKGNNGTQATSANRLTFFPNDPFFGGLSSFGSTSNVGVKHLVAGGSTTPRHVIASCYYLSGNETSFPVYTGLFGTSTPSPTFILGDAGGNGDWYHIFDRNGTYSKNGGATQARTIRALPLPASTLVFNSATTPSNTPYQFGCDVGTPDRSWRGGFRNAIIATGSISSADMALIEGVIAWDGTHQNQLVASHPYRYRPPLLRD